MPASGGDVSRTALPRGFNFSGIPTLRCEAMGTGITRKSVAKKSPGPALPAMFGRYKARVEQELSGAVPTPHSTDPSVGSGQAPSATLRAGPSTASGQALYTLLRYHLGWVDPQGGPLASSAFQGKALRPTLCLFACEALGGDLGKASCAAAALELIHNFSLIHDDIQDQDQERRHQPTVWHLWGVPRALVAGNAMQSVGDLALLQVSRLNVSPETTLKVSQLLTESYLQMIQGQCLDLGFEDRNSIRTEDYLHMIAYKTGALIRSGLEMGALLATEDSVPVRAFARFGDYLGRVFQIRDDFLGIWGDEATTGKPTGNDIRRRKKSFPVVFALERASGQAREDLLRIYGQGNLDENDVAEVIDVLHEVGAPEYSQQLTEESAEQALQALREISLPSWAKAEVEGLVEFLSRREY